MLEKKRQEKPKALTELEKTITEILVANGRAIEPFIKIFNQSGENVTKSSLGSLVGVFEIADQSEDSAYIVNFLASVAKKEYFSNSRRGSIESFEAALHKINLALAELVKHGNIAWLGKLHGVLGVLEKNNLHFSVTGKAEILLYRGDSFTEISAGLASEESNIHPIKTFVEISSGRLMIGDKIILTSPELFDLLSLEDLEKNASRMDTERFTQFLRTVLVNELDMGGSLVVDIKEGALLPLPQKEPKKTVEIPTNVFSEKAFVPQIKTEQSTGSLPDEKNVSKSEEYVDSKTGHIYVQGNTPNSTPENLFLERAKLTLQDSLHSFGSFFISQGKFLRKGKKQGLLFLHASSRQGIVVTRKTVRFFRKLLRKGISVSAAKISSLRSPQIQKGVHTDTLPHTPTTPTYTQIPPQQSFSSERKVESLVPRTPDKPAQTSKLSPLTKNEYNISDGHNETDEDETIPPFMREKLAAFYQKNTVSSQVPFETPLSNEPKEQTLHAFILLAQKSVRKISSLLHLFYRGIVSRIHSLFKHSILFFKNFNFQYRKISFVFGIFFITILIALFFVVRSFSKESVPPQTTEVFQETNEVVSFPLNTEKNAHLLTESPIIIASVQEPVVASVILSDETYLITSTYILSLNDKKRYALPSGSGAIQFASPMDDLRLIFVSTDKKELYSWSPISHTYTRNTLALPENVLIEDIGTYLTYLYVLDKTTNQIYRFPRAEGGFGGGSIWLRDSLTIEDTAKMAINETIFLAPNKTTVAAFFRGRFVKNLESPNTPLSVAGLFTHPGLINIYALDRENKRVLIWNQDGTLLGQYYSEKIADAKSITANEKTNEVFLTTENSLLSFKFNLGQ